MTSCTSGVYACNSNALQVCNQNSWETILQCDASLNQYCQASPYYNCAGSSSTGTATCTNGQYFCLDNALQVCLNGSNVTILHCDSSQGQVCRSNPYYDCFGSTTITLTTATTQISTKTTTTKTIAKTTSKTTKTTTTTQTTTTTTTTSTTTTTTTNTSTTTSSNKYKLITYWGQDSGYYTNGQLQTSLYSYCATGFFDVINLAFLYQFGGTTPADFQLDLSNYGSYSYIGGVASGSFANDVGADIIACQNLGVKVLLSLGGGVGAYSVPSGSGTAIGQMLHNSFFGGSSSARPFGSAVLNGIDWDIEASGSSQSDIVAVNQYLHANNENLDISGAPQCPYPDAYLGGSIAMANSGYTFLNVQFYNK
ncbi:hypothetical protein HDU82_009088 [Entophlyctis luteolus]|nr:hypothetical protein HDU82_009088 [Entophlyctis luteolus]